MSTAVSGPILRRGDGAVPGADYLPCDPDEVLWGRLPCAADRPVISTRPGLSLTVDTLSHEGLLPDQGSDPRAFFGRHGVDPELVLEESVALTATRTRATDDGPHVVTGPIEVVGARPGDVLAIHIEAAERRVPYGVISNRHGRGALPGELPRGSDTYSAFAAVRDIDGEAYAVLPRRRGGDLGETGSVVSFPLAEFPGIVGVAVPGSSRPHSVPPGAHGGNLDINLMRPGATVYLPVRVPGALAYLGDPHFAQGDGEVALTALEASLRVTLRLEVLDPSETAARFGDLLGPLVETADHLVPTGLDEDLDVAVQNCVRAALALLEARYGMDCAQAYAYLSAATDFNISQVVDLVKGVHARIRKADFER